MSTPTQAELDSLMIPWSSSQVQHTRPISKNVIYLGSWPGFGELTARWCLWYWDKTNVQAAARGKALYRTQECQEKVLDAALASLKDCVVLSTTPSYYSQYQSACLLKSRGFELVGGKCYKHPGYPALSNNAIEHPGIPDRYEHWEHIWYKVIGEPKEIGVPDSGANFSLNNCGVSGGFGLDSLKLKTAKNPCHLAVGWLPRGTLFPEGWKCFYSAEDHKLGVNFEHPNLKNAQKCPHNFDLKIFKDWEPDFSKWRPV